MPEFSPEGQSPPHSSGHRQDKLSGIHHSECRLQSQLIVLEIGLKVSFFVLGLKSAAFKEHLV
jgi:hypothetical protein